MNAVAFPERFEKLDRTLVALLQIAEPTPVAPAKPSLIRRLSLPRASATFNFGALAAMTGGIAVVAGYLVTGPTKNEGAPVTVAQVATKPAARPREVVLPPRAVAPALPNSEQVVQAAPVDVTPAVAPTPAAPVEVAAATVTRAPAKIATKKPIVREAAKFRFAASGGKAAKPPVVLANKSIKSPAEPKATPSAAAKPGKAFNSISLAAIVRQARVEAVSPPAARPPLTFVEIRPAASDQRPRFGGDADDDARAARRDAKDKPDRKKRLDSLDAVRNLRRQL